MNILKLIIIFIFLRRTSIVKVHPDNIRVVIRAENVSSLPGIIYPTISRGLCRRGLIQYFEKLVILLRNPFKSFWSEYQRISLNNHAGAIGRWFFFSLLLFFLFSMNRFTLMIWNVRSSFDRDDWELTSIQLALYYKHMFIHELFLVLNHFDPAQYLIVKYEDLLDSRIKIDTLRSIVDFIGHSTSNDRLKCSFELADR